MEKEKKEKIKKLLIFGGVIIAIIAILTAVFHNDNKYVLKNEYKLGEVGYIDDIELSLEKIEYINQESGIQLSFKITNKTKNTITITPDDYFKFYDINTVQIPNKFTNNKNIIKKDETVIYKLQYDVTKKELYEIYFYSQIVENNIKFSFKSSDIISTANIEESDKNLTSELGS